MDNWQNRIVGLEYKPANQLLANPRNPRIHPGKQREALRGSLDTLGWYDVVIENRRTGELLDGHARVEEQLTKDEHALIPVLVIDLDPDEQNLALANHDWITGLATYDRDTLDSLLQDLNTDEPRLQAMLAEMAVEQGLIIPDGFPEYDETVADEVEYLTCPHCGEQFPK
jgi:hypothetical protein